MISSSEILNASILLVEGEDQILPVQTIYGGKIVEGHQRIFSPEIGPGSSTEEHEFREADTGDAMMSYRRLKK